MSSGVQDQIVAANREFMAAFGKRDGSAIARLYTDDAQVFPANSDIIRGPAAILEFWQGVFALGLTGATLETLEVDVSGGIAVEVGRYWLLAGETVADQGKYLVVWKNDAGRWKLHRDIWNTSQPAAAQA